MLRMIRSETMPLITEFFSFKGRLSKERTQLLWNRHLARMKINNKKINPLVELIAAHKILIEKEKSLEEISSEMRRRGWRTSYSSVMRINQLLKIRTGKKLYIRGGGPRKKIPREIVDRMVELYNQGYNAKQIAGMLEIRVHPKTVMDKIKLKLNLK